MTDLQARLVAALHEVRQQTPRECDLRCINWDEVDVEHSDSCSARWTARVDARVATCVEAAVRAYGATELPSESIRALFGEPPSRWYVNDKEYATMEDAEAALVAERFALKEAAGLAAFLAAAAQKETT